MEFYDWIVYAHILFAMAWLGGLVYVNALMFSVTRTGDQALMAQVGLRVGKVNVVYLPTAGILTVVAGLWLASDDRWNFGDAWIIWALILTGLVILTAIFYIVPLFRSVERTVATTGPSPDIAAKMQRIGLLARLIAVVLLFVLLLMVWRPGA